MSRLDKFLDAAAPFIASAIACGLIFALYQIFN